HVVDEEFRRPIGRPWITVATDIATRMISGIYLTLEAPSELSVAMCLAHAVLPKETWLAERKISAEWPVWGAPKRVHTDNGSDFAGESLRRGCEDYGIAMEFRPPGRAHYGGHIERLIGTLMQRVHTLPGTSYSNPQERGDYQSEQSAVLTLKELEYWLTLEICVHYHGAIHRTLGTSPLVAWETALQRGVAAVAAPGCTAILPRVSSRRGSNPATHRRAAREHSLLVRHAADHRAPQRADHGSL